MHIRRRSDHRISAGLDCGLVPLLPLHQARAVPVAAAAALPRRAAAVLRVCAPGAAAQRAGDRRHVAGCQVFAGAKAAVRFLFFPIQRMHTAINSESKSMFCNQEENGFRTYLNFQQCTGKYFTLLSMQYRPELLAVGEAVDAVLNRIPILAWFVRRPGSGRGHGGGGEDPRSSFLTSGATGWGSGASVR